MAKAHALKVYHSAMRFGDLGTAIHAMHTLLAIDSSVDHMDSLAVLYYQTDNYPQAIQAAQFVLDKRENDEDMLELTARSYQQMNRPDLASSYFSRLYANTGDLQFQYQAATSAFLMEEYDKAVELGSSILDKPNADSTLVVITFGNGRQQVVPVTAAVYNLLGSIDYNRNDKTGAQKNFNLALREFPEFSLAVDNLKKLQ